MPVEVPGQAGTGGLALIQPNVVALRPEHPIQNPRHSAQCLDRFDQIQAFQFLQGASMHARSHQEVSIIVRVTVQDHDAIRMTRNDKIFAVLAAGQTAAEEAWGDGL
jgi:hypothetical protein